MNKSEKEMYKLMLGEEFSVMKKEEDDLNPFLDNWRILNLQNKIDLLKELKGYSDLNPYEPSRRENLTVGEE